MCTGRQILEDGIVAQKGETLSLDEIARPPLDMKLDVTLEPVDMGELCLPSSIFCPVREGVQ